LSVDQVSGPHPEDDGLVWPCATADRPRSAIAVS